MRELFRYARLDPEQLNLAMAAQHTFERLARRGLTATWRLLHNELDAHGLVDDWPRPRFRRCVRRWQWGGHLDWLVPPDQPATPLLTHDSPLEIWAPERVALPLADLAAAGGRVLTVTPYRLGWCPHHLYHAATRLQPWLGKNARVLYLSDQPDDGVSVSRLNQLLGHVLTVRLAREGFNRQAGRQLWAPDRLSELPQHGPGCGHRKLVQHHLAQARALVRDGLRVACVAPPPGTASFDLMRPGEIADTLVAACGGLCTALPEPAKP
jgi:hypothetical protein